MPSEWAERSVAAQEGDPGSTLALYRTAIAARPSGAFAWREGPPGTLVFERGDIVCAVNVDGDPLALPQGEVLVASAPVGDALPPAAAAWIRVS
jgi:alpha-glucosidase